MDMKTVAGIAVIAALTVAALNKIARRSPTVRNLIS